MKRLAVFGILTLAVAIALVGCGRTPVEEGESDRISVVTTIFPEYDFARAIVGNEADLVMLVSPGAEIHSYEPSPADIITIQDADVFIYIGGESDIWVDTILESMDTSSMRIVRLMESVTPVEEEIVEGMEEHESEEALEGEEDEGGHEDDEHIWTSPKNAILMVDAIAEAVCAADPAHAELYRDNASAYVDEIERVDAEFREIAEDSKTRLMVFGDRFPFRYFADEYGLEYRAAFNGCSTETEASAATIAFLVDTIEEKDLSHVFYIELSNQNIARSLSEQTGAEMLLLHSCQSISKADFDSGKTYVSLMRQNAENLRKGLD